MQVYDKSIARRIYTIREKHFLSQREFAELTNANQSSVCLWETGKTFPKMYHLEAIANNFDVSLEWLIFGWEERMKARMIVKCGRCGYQYDPANPEKPLLQFVGKDGKVYTACVDCITELGEIEDEDEKTRFIKSFGGDED